MGIPVFNRLRLSRVCVLVSGVRSCIINVFRYFRVPIWKRTSEIRSAACSRAIYPELNKPRADSRLSLYVCGSVAVPRYEYVPRITMYHIHVPGTNIPHTALINRQNTKVQIRWRWPYASDLFSGTAILPRQAHKPAALAATPAVVIPTTGKSLLAVCLAWLMVQSVPCRCI